MRFTWTRTLAAAAAATAATLGLTALPAQASLSLTAGCNDTHNHCWAGEIIDGTFIPWAEGFIEKPGGGTAWYVKTFNQGAQNLIPWVDVLTADGRDIQFPGTSTISPGDPFPVSVSDNKYYTIVSWRLCDPETGKCTAFVTVPW